MYTLKKSLGQHFLKDQSVINDILFHVKQHAFTQLLEVGPGGGAITRDLLHLPDVDFKMLLT